MRRPKIGDLSYLPFLCPSIALWNNMIIIILAFITYSTMTNAWIQSSCFPCPYSNHDIILPSNLPQRLHVGMLLLLKEQEGVTWDSLKVLPPHLGCERAISGSRTECLQNQRTTQSLHIWLSVKESAGPKPWQLERRNANWKEQNFASFLVPLSVYSVS